MRELTTPSKKIMIKRADSFLLGTREHPICQDYVFVDKEEPTDDFNPPKILGGYLADGCSSSPNTDIGARLLVHNCKRMKTKYLGLSLEDQHTVEQICTRIPFNLLGPLGLNTSAMDATLLSGVVVDGRFNIYLRGDGIVAFIKNESLVVYIYDYLANGPNYYTYDHDPGRQLAYSKYAKNQKRKRSFVYDIPGGVLYPTLVETFQGNVGPFARPYQELGVEPILSWDKDTVPDAVLLSSDGLESLYDPEGEYNTCNPELDKMAFVNTILKLMSIKNFSNGFLQRRASRFFEDNTVTRVKHGKKSINWSDDIGLVYLGF